MKVISGKNSEQSSPPAPPPSLAGYSFPFEDALRARKEKKLLTIEMEISDTGLQQDTDVLKILIRDAGDLGARSVIMYNHSPHTHADITELTAYIESLKMTPVIVIGYGVLSDNERLFFRDHSTSIVLLTNGKNDRLCDEAHGLLDSGFGFVNTNMNVRLGIAIKPNGGATADYPSKEEIFSLWHFCRRNNVYPDFESSFCAAGNGQTGYSHTPADAKQVTMELQNIDRTYYNFHWLPFIPRTGAGCHRFLSNVYITISGDAHLCGYSRFNEQPSFYRDGGYQYSIFKMPLRRILDSKLFAYARTIDARLEGRCAACEYGNRCIGCRAHAFNHGISKGVNPYAALRAECPRCFKT